MNNTLPRFSRFSQLAAERGKGKGPLIQTKSEKPTHAHTPAMSASRTIDVLSTRTTLQDVYSHLMKQDYALEDRIAFLEKNDPYEEINQMRKELTTAQQAFADLERDVRGLKNAGGETGTAPYYFSLHPHVLPSLTNSRASRARCVSLFLLAPPSPPRPPPPLSSPPPY